MDAPLIKTLNDLTADEAWGYLARTNQDELAAALCLAEDRGRLEGLKRAPDALEVHHALFLLRRARGLRAPSFDWLRIELRKLAA